MSDALQDIEAELAALADGSLDPERREDVLKRVRESPELEAALAEQRQAVAMMAAVDVRAPAGLHREIEAMLAPGRERQARGGRAFWRPRFGLALGAAATATAVVAVVIALSGGGSSRLDVQQTAALALSPATTHAPAESKAHKSQLAASVDGVAFPYWKERFGWRSSWGSRRQARRTRGDDGFLHRPPGSADRVRDRIGTRAHHERGHARLRVGACHTGCSPTKARRS